MASKFGRTAMSIDGVDPNYGQDSFGGGEEARGGEGRVPGREEAGAAR